MRFLSLLAFGFSTLFWGCAGNLFGSEYTSHKFPLKLNMAIAPPLPSAPLPLSDSAFLMAEASFAHSDCRDGRSFDTFTLQVGCNSLGGSVGLRLWNSAWDVRLEGGGGSAQGLGGIDVGYNFGKEYVTVRPHLGLYWDHYQVESRDSLWTHDKLEGTNQGGEAQMPKKTKDWQTEIVTGISLIRANGQFRPWVSLEVEQRPTFESDLVNPMGLEGSYSVQGGLAQISGGVLVIEPSGWGASLGVGRVYGLGDYSWNPWKGSVSLVYSR